MKAILKQVRISPKKANLIAQLVRNHNAVEAINILKYTPKKGAAILKKVVESAVANAENNFKQNRETLVIKEIIVSDGPTYKRSIPISRGRVHPLLKRTSHITVKVETAKDAPETKKNTTKSATTKETAAKSETTNTPETTDTPATPAKSATKDRKKTATTKPKSTK